MSVFRIFTSETRYQLLDADSLEHATRKAAVIFGSVVRIEPVVVTQSFKTVAQEYGVKAAEGASRKVRSDFSHARS